TDLLDDLEQRKLVEQIGRQQRDAIEQVIDAPVIGRAEAAGRPKDLVTLFKQQFGEVRAVLSRDARDKCALGHSNSGQFSLTKTFELYHGVRCRRWIAAQR